MGAEALVRIAERHNPRRSFLLVSTVLGKHLPVGAARCRLSGLALGLLVAGDQRAEAARTVLLEGTDEAALAFVDAIEAAPAGTVADPRPPGMAAAWGLADDAGPGLGDEPFESFVVVGFAETATALAEQVASALDAAWWQTTTRQSAIAERGLRFDESHSHAPDQWIARPADGWPDGTLVLVDDELTTGSTACNLIEVLHAEHPRDRYVIAALLDGRGELAAAGGPIEATAARLGVTIDVVALATRDAEDRTEAGWSGGRLPAQRLVAPNTATVRDVVIGFEGALQHEGQDRTARLELAGASVCGAAGVGPLPGGALVLGTGEHLAFAQRSAVLAGALTSSSTRSPVLVSDLPDYPIRDGLAFPNPDDLEVPGFAYNVHADRRPAIVVHFQDAAHRQRGQAFLDMLGAAGARELVAVTLAP